MISGVFVLLDPRYIIFLLLVGGMGTAASFMELDEDQEYDFIIEGTRSQHPAMDRPEDHNQLTLPANDVNVDQVKWSDEALEYRLFDGEISPATEIVEVDFAEDTVVYSTEGEPAYYGGEDVRKTLEGANKVMPYFADIQEDLQGIANGEDEVHYDDVPGEEANYEQQEENIPAPMDEQLDKLNGLTEVIREQVREQHYSM